MHFLYNRCAINRLPTLGPQGYKLASFLYSRRCAVNRFGKAR